MPPLCGRQDLGVSETFNLPDSPMGWLLFSPVLKMRVSRFSGTNRDQPEPEWMESPQAWWQSSQGSSFSAQIC